ncbi:MAG: hypothetical protein AAFP87_03705 [Pseudomonadota bacterium]
MPTLYLHLGMGKTGSSFLQSVLAASADTLDAHGIRYPLPPALRREAAAGKVTSGNRARFVKTIQEAPDSLLAGPSHLFSNETMTELFEDARFVSVLTALQERGLKLRCLLFVRDPAELLVSSYLQRVKQQDLIAPFNNYATGQAVAWQHRVMARLRNLVALCDRHGFELQLHNYSRVRGNMVALAHDFLELPNSADLTVPARVVNRSVGAVEVGVNLGLAQAFGGLIPMQNRNYTRRLVDATSDLRVPTPRFDRDAIAAFLNAIAQDVATTNAVLPEAARYSLNMPPEPDSADPYGMDFGTHLAREAVRATLLTLEQNLDDAGREVVLAQVLKADLDPGVDVVRRYVQLLIRKGKHDEALSILENHDLGPDAVELLQQHVTCLLAQGRGRDAVDLAQAAFDADPTHRRTGPSLILALHETGDAGQARAVLAKIQSTGASPRRIAKLAARLDRDAKGKQV